MTNPSLNPASSTNLETDMEFSSEDLASLSSAILADSGPAVSPATRMAEEAAKATVNADKVDPALLTLFEDLASRAVAEKITASAAIRTVVETFPEATRIAVKHTAALVGINPLTARNVFDRISKAADHVA